MSGRPPYTVEQVSRQLGLSEGVVRRVSNSLQLPSLFYPEEKGKPRLMLYSDLEVDILQRVQALLVEGYSIEEARQSLKDLLALSQYQSALPPEEAMGLVNYDDDGMKATLAQTSLAQYRAAQAPKKPVFQAMMSRISRALPGGEMSTASPFVPGKVHPGWVSPANSWMSPVFQDVKKH